MKGEQRMERGRAEDEEKRKEVGGRTEDRSQGKERRVKRE